MRIVTYLGFTLLSILIQFSVMDFIQSIMQLDEKIIENKTSQKRQLRDVLKDLENKPHALFYRTQLSKVAKIYDNTTLPDLISFTESTTGVFEILYDDSTFSTEGEDTSTTSEAIYTSTEFDNVTEITFIGNTSITTAKSDIKPMMRENKDCKCNLLYGICDISCCCDVDCSESELTMFLNCKKNVTKHHDDDICYLHLFYFGQDSPIAAVLNNWFCIVKVNLPEMPKENKKIHPFRSNNFFTWKGKKPKFDYEFKNKMYSYGDPIWIIKNDSIYYVDLAVPVINNYCTGRKTIQFLNNYKNSCYVKISDLEMFQIMKSTEEASVVSATPKSINSTYLNCSSLHCINWTLIICESLTCENYNKTIHEPWCTDTVCTKLALKLEYIFNFHDSRITNATIKLHVQNVKVQIPYLVQTIEVKFILGNESIERAVKFSGNLGYIDGLPVIVSYAESNYTDHFYKSSKPKTYFALPESNSGTCVNSNLTDNFVLFGSNRRIKCRYYHKSTKVLNSTEQCINIQTNISKLLELSKVAVSPLGDPKSMKDADWIPMAINVSEKALIYGELHEKTSKLYCYNMITQYSFMFIYSEVATNNRILGIKLSSTTRNSSFNIDDVSIVVTIDVSFVDVSKPTVVDTSHPSSNFFLPNDFFLPFPSNESQVARINVLCFIIILLHGINSQQIK